MKTAVIVFSLAATLTPVSAHDYSKDFRCMVITPDGDIAWSFAVNTGGLFDAANGTFVETRAAVIGKVTVYEAGKRPVWSWAAYGTGVRLISQNDPSWVIDAANASTNLWHGSKHIGSGPACIIPQADPPPTTSDVAPE